MNNTNSTNSTNSNLNNSSFKIRNSRYLYELKNKLKHRCKRYPDAFFVNSSTKIFNAIINNKEKIIKTGKINFKELLPEDKFIKLQKVNSTKINIDGFVIQSINDEIVNLLTNIIAESYKKPFDDREANDVYDDEFIDCIKIDESDDDNFVIPKPTLDKTGLMYNLFKDNNIQFIFNDKINNINENNNKYVCTKKIKITSSYTSKVELPTKVSITCKHYVVPKKNDNFEPYICNNIKTFAPIDALHSDIKCKFNHTIKNVDEATPEETRTIYIYNAKDITFPDNVNNIIIFSFNIIEDEEIICNAVPSYNKKTMKNDYFILGWKPLVDNKKPLKNPILLKNSKYNHLFLLDIFESIKEYFKTYHNEFVKDQNKIVGLVMILQFLCQRYFKILYPGLLLGKSASGKSYYFNIFSKILLHNAVKVEPTVTRNKFIGGQDIISANNSKTFLPGYVNTADFIFINEMAGKIEEYLNYGRNKNFNIDNNLFSMHKQCYDSSENNKVNVGIQGSVEIDVNAVPFSVGNFTKLKTNKKYYLSQLKKHYKIFNGGSLEGFKVSIPLFKPLKYYLEDVNNELLMKAHAKTREEYEGYFMTGLEIADQSRFTFFIVIDPDSPQIFKDNPERSFLGKIKHRAHKKELLEELDNIFLKGLDKYSEKTIHKFLKDVYKWVYIYYRDHKNQFCFDSGEIPGHLHKNLSKMNGDLLLLHKLYYDLPLTFTDEDKKTLKYFNSFNYNFLSTKEAAMIKKPYSFDIDIDKDNIERDLDKGEELIKKKKEEEGIIDIDDDLINESVDFGGLPKDEFD